MKRSLTNTQRIISFWVRRLFHFQCVRYLRVSRRTSNKTGDTALSFGVGGIYGLINLAVNQLQIGMGNWSREHDFPRGTGQRFQKKKVLGTHGEDDKNHFSFVNPLLSSE